MSWCAHSFWMDRIPVIRGRHGMLIPKKWVLRSARMGGWHTHQHQCVHCKDQFITSCWEPRCMKPLLFSLHLLPDEDEVLAEPESLAVAESTEDPLRQRLIELLRAHPLSVDEAWMRLPGESWSTVAWHLHMLNLLSIINWPAPPQVSRRSDFRYTVRT